MTKPTLHRFPPRHQEEDRCHRRADPDQVPEIPWFKTDPPPETKRYLVTDGESVGIDTWVKESMTPAGYVAHMLPSQTGPEHENPRHTYRWRWAKYENVVAYSPVALG